MATCHGVGRIKHVYGTCSNRKMIDSEVVNCKYLHLLVVPLRDSSLWPSPADEA